MTKQGKQIQHVKQHSIKQRIIHISFQILVWFGAAMLYYLVI